jgi:hypothetical protein
MSTVFDSYNKDSCRIFESSVYPLKAQSVKEDTIDLGLFRHEDERYFFSTNFVKR